MRFLVTCFLAAIAAPVLAGCTISKSCTLLGCSDGASLAIDAPFAGGSAPLHFELCRNGQCTATGGDGGSQTVAAASRQRQSCGFVWSTDLEPDCFYDLGADDRLHVQGRLGAPNSADHSQLHDGDVYHLVVTTGMGTVVLDVSTAVTYTRNQPNGADCDGAYYCQNADVHRSL